MKDSFDAAFDAASATPHPLALTLLGGTLLLERREGAEARPVLASGKPLALISFLHCAPAKSATREQLLELLWSDAEPDAGRHTLRQTLWYIKRKLGIDPLATTGDGVRIAIEIASDREDFLGALHADDPERALACYTGDFFPEFAAPGGAGFEQWADLERTRLRALFVGAATRVVRDCLSRGHARDATTIASRVQALAPRHQGAWRLLLESHLAADDQIGAAVELERLERWLASEELEPDAATLQLIKSVRAGKTRAVPEGETASVGLQAELVGRETEFSELVAAFESIKRGHTKHLHIAAPAGLGKTRLLDGFAARLRASRVRVVAVRATIAERSLPYAFAAQLVAALVQLRGAAAVSPDAARTLVALAPTSSNFLNAEPDRSTGEEALRRRSIAVTELVATVAHDAALVLLVDDVHWMDSQSRTLLASLATRLSDASLLLVTAARPGEPFLDSTPDVQRLVLAPLSLDDVGSLVMSVGRLPSEPCADAFVHGLLSASNGSPLLVLEALQLVMEQGQLQLVDQTWTTPDSAALVATLGAGRAMQQRLSALPIAARDALLRLAVAGAALPDNALPQVLPVDGRDSLALLESRGLVTRHDGAWRVAHDEIAALAIELAADADRVRANDAMATYLERVAHHDVSLLLRAAWHRARASDMPALDRVFLRAVRNAHVTGEQDAIRTMGREVLGTSASGHDVERLLQRLPWSVRTRTTRWGVGAAIAVSVAALVTIAALTRPAAKPLAARLGTFEIRHGDTSAYVALPDVINDLARDDAIDLPDVPSPLSDTTTRGVNIVGQLADSTFVGAALRTDDKKIGMDIFRVTRAGIVEPLVGGDRDQSAPVVSADGRRILYSTGEWEDDQSVDLALYDVASHTTTRLTASKSRELYQLWSRDGTRIAYVSSPATPGDAEVCWRTVDTLSGACRRLPSGYIPAQVVAWRSDNALLVAAERSQSPGRALLQLDLDVGSTRVLDSAGVDYQADPSGRMVLCLCQVRGISALVQAVFSPESPMFKRPLRYRGEYLRRLGGEFAVWEPDRVALSAIKLKGPSSARLHTSVTISIKGLDLGGRVRSVPFVRWQSLDSTKAVSVGNGVFRLQSAGEVRIVANAGGALADTLRLTVNNTVATNELRESWSDSLSARWILMGDPSPSIVNNTLHVNGDDHLSSGVVSRGELDIQHGAGLRARVRLPLNAVRWQSIHLGLYYLASPGELGAWKHPDTDPQPAAWNARQQGRSCILAAPRAEGGEFTRLILLFAGGAAARLPANTPEVGDGRWHTIVLQIFEDLHCGLAIDGKAVAISETPVTSGLPLRVWIDGQSVNTTVEVGAVDAWTGITNDIDWSVLTTTAANTQRDHDAPHVAQRPTSGSGRDAGLPSRPPSLPARPTLPQRPTPSNPAPVRDIRPERSH